MYRLLIVDDEPVIVDGLAQLFREQEPDLDVCQAYSGIEALAWIKRTKVDIVITDIRMPEKNGLQLIDELAHYWPACKIIFLTGYDEFDYVYSAIQKNAAHYILKTEDDAVLLKAVKQCIRQLDEEARRVGMLEAARSQLALMGPMYRKQLLEALLCGEKLPDLLSHDGEGDIRPATTLKPRNPVLLLACKADRWRQDADFSHKLRLFDSIQHIVEARMARSIVSESLVFQHEMIVWLIQPEPDSGKFDGTDGTTDWRALSAYLTGMLESVQRDCGDWADESLSFVIARQPAAWNDLHREFDLIRIYMKRRLFPTRDAAVVDLGMSGGMEGGSADAPLSNPFEFKRKLDDLEKSLDGDEAAGFERVCRELLDDIRQQLAIQYLTGTEKYYGFLLVFLREMDTIGIEHVSITDIPTDWEAASGQFIQLGRRIIANKTQGRQQEGDALIRRLQNYIQDHLGSDLSLVRMAEAMFFNPSYLSRLYKQHTGTNLSDYIHAARLDAAKRLLEEPGIKVNDIAEKLGFSSPSYFSTFFRKMTGRTPQEYREESAGSGRMSTK